MLHSFEWHSIIPGIKDIPVHVFHSMLVVSLLCLLVLLANRQLRRRDLEVVPPRRFGLLSFFEMFYEGLLNIATEIIGHTAPKYLWLIASLALFILFNNLLGVIPGLTQPTDNVNTTAACALVVFFATHFYGFKEHGLGYLKHFVGPSIWLAPLMIPIEIIGHLARPLSLSLRLFGNMFGDHMVLTVFIFMMTGLTKAILSSTPLLWIFAPLAPLVPIVVYVLGIFVMVVQTLVFILLTMSYISGAVADAH